jgi:hypothetical protein
MTRDDGISGPNPTSFNVKRYVTIQLPDQTWEAGMFSLLNHRGQRPLQSFTREGLTPGLSYQK